MSVEAALRDNEFDQDVANAPTLVEDPRSVTSRFAVPGTSALAAILLLAGTTPVSQWVTTTAPPIVLPSALGTPHLVPPLRIVPFTGMSVTQWAFDVVGALVALVVCWVWVTSSRRLAQRPTRGRAFRTTWLAAFLAIVIGNVVRYVLISFTLEAAIGNYALSVLLTVVFAALFASVVALVPALAAMLPRPTPKTD